MRMIDPIALKESIAFSAIMRDGKSLERIIDEQPPAQPKKGKWVPVKPDNPWHVNNVYRCDQCGNFLDFYGVNAGRGDANYCPNCGAKMEVTE